MNFLSSLFDVCRMFPYAVLCGCIVAISCGFIGVFVLLKRMVFISVALSECSACGIAAASLLGIPAFGGAAACSLLSVLLLSRDWEQQRIPRDAMLGAVFVGASALSVLLVSHSGMGLLEIKALLYGDLLLASGHDCALLAAVHIPLFLLGLLFLKPLLYVFLDRNCSQILNLPVRFLEIAFFVCLAIAISSAGKTCGALLVFCNLSVTPAIGLLLSKRLHAVLALTILSSLISTLGGLAVAFHFDLPGNQCIIVFACALLTLALLYRRFIRRV